MLESFRPAATTHHSRSIADRRAGDRRSENDLFTQVAYVPRFPNLALTLSPSCRGVLHACEILLRRYSARPIGMLFRAQRQRCFYGMIVARTAPCMRDLTR